MPLLWHAGICHWNVVTTTVRKHWATLLMSSMGYRVILLAFYSTLSSLTPKPEYSELSKTVSETRREWLHSAALCFGHMIHIWESGRQWNTCQEAKDHHHHPVVPSASATCPFTYQSACSKLINNKNQCPFHVKNLHWTCTFALRERTENESYMTDVSHIT